MHLYDRAMSLHRRAWEYQEQGRTLKEYSENFRDEAFTVDVAATFWSTALSARDSGLKKETAFPLALDLQRAGLIDPA